MKRVQVSYLTPFFIGRSTSGKSRDFDSLIGGSNPSRPTIKIVLIVDKFDALNYCDFM